MPSRGLQPSDLEAPQQASSSGTAAGLHRRDGGGLPRNGSGGTRDDDGSKRRHLGRLGTQAYGKARYVLTARWKLLALVIAGLLVRVGECRNGGSSACAGAGGYRRPAATDFQHPGLPALACPRPRPRRSCTR
jgi:hypothetical protein